MRRLVRGSALLVTVSALAAAAVSGGEPPAGELDGMLHLELLGAARPAKVVVVVRCDGGTVTAVFSHYRGTLLSAHRAGLKVAGGRLAGSAKLPIGQALYVYELDCRPRGLAVEGTWRVEYGAPVESRRIGGAVTGTWAERSGSSGALRLTLAGAVEGKPLEMALELADGRVASGTGATPQYNRATHTVDGAGLALKGGALRGRADLTIRPDAWVPPHRQDVACTVSIDAAVDGAGVKGTYSGVWAAARTAAGKVRGVRTPLADLRRDNALQAGRDWPTWRGPDSSGSAVETGASLVDDLAAARLMWISDRPIPGARVSDSRQVVPKEGHLISGGFASPVAADGRVYLTYYVPGGDVYDERIAERHAAGGGFGKEKWAIDADDVIHCFDAATGATLWRRVFRGEGMNFNLFNKGGPCNLSACVAAGRAYAVGSGGKVYCVDAATGEVVWDSDVGRRYAILRKLQALCREKKQLAQRNRDMGSAPVVAGGVVVCSDFLGYTVQTPVREYRWSDGCGVVGLDAATGRKLWHRPGTLGNWATPAVWRHGDAEYVVAAGKGMLTCIEPKTGNLLWRCPAGNNSYSVAVAGDYLVGAGGGETPDVTCYRLTAKGAEKCWSLPTRCGGTGATPPVIYAGWVYARCEAGKLVCAELATGRIAGEIALPGGMGFAVAGNRRLLIDADCSHDVDAIHLFAADPPRFTALGGPWAAPNAGGYMNPVTPALADGRLFLRAKDALVCYDLRRPARP